MYRLLIVEDEEFLRKSLCAVSYTHLDVYKRQLVTHDEADTPPGLGQRPPGDEPGQTAGQL